jgi:translation initiation factor 1
VHFSNNENPTVYSSEFGRVCPDCKNPIKRCICQKKKNQLNVIKNDGIVRLRIDRKGRGGKSVTLIEGLPKNEEFLKTTTKEIKKLCGTGGAVKEGTIEIQGDVREFLLQFFENKGIKVKKAGG